jgi:hypothetical protein
MEPEYFVLRQEDGRRADGVRRELDAASPLLGVKQAAPG